MSESLGKPLSRYVSDHVPEDAFWAVVVVLPRSKEPPYISSPCPNVHDAIAILETLLQKLKEGQGN